MILNTVKGIITYRKGPVVKMEVTSRFFKRQMFGKVLRYKDVVEFTLLDLETSTEFGELLLSKKGASRLVPGVRIRLLNVNVGGHDVVKVTIFGEPLLVLHPARLENLPKYTMILGMLADYGKLHREYGDRPNILKLRDATNNALRAVEETRKQVGTTMAKALNVPYVDNDLFYFRDGDVPLVIQHPDLTDRYQ